MPYTTNYINTLIEPAEDCPNLQGTIPVGKSGKETIASLQYRLLQGQPYQMNSDALLFRVYAARKDIDAGDAGEWQAFFAKPQACLRASPLTKQFGWAIHADAAGHIALIDPASDRYKQLLEDPEIKKVKGMRSSSK